MPAALTRLDDEMLKKMFSFPQSILYNTFETTDFYLPIVAFLAKKNGLSLGIMFVKSFLNTFQILSRESTDTFISITMSCVCTIRHIQPVQPIRSIQSVVSCKGILCLSNKIYFIM